MFFTNLRPLASSPASTDSAESVILEQEKENIRKWKADHPDTTIKEQRDLLAAGRIDHLPWDPPPGRSLGFGLTMPEQASKGDTFVLTKTWPSQIFKHNGSKWIKVDKTLSDQYCYDEQYIQHLIERLAEGTVDVDSLSDAEREQVQLKLKQSHGQ